MPAAKQIASWSEQVGVLTFCETFGIDPLTTPQGKIQQSVKHLAEAKHKTSSGLIEEMASGRGKESFLRSNSDCAKERLLYFQSLSNTALHQRKIASGPDPPCSTLNQILSVYQQGYRASQGRIACDPLKDRIFTAGAVDKNCKRWLIADAYKACTDWDTFRARYNIKDATYSAEQLLTAVTRRYRDCELSTCTALLGRAF